MIYNKPDKGKSKICLSQKNKSIFVSSIEHRSRISQRFSEIPFQGKQVMIMYPIDMRTLNC